MLSDPEKRKKYHKYGKDWQHADQFEEQVFYPIIKHDNMKLLIIILFIIAMIVLLVFLIVRNQKNEKDLEEKLKEDYPRDKENDTQNNEPLQ